MSNYSYERDSKNNLTKKVVFHKFKMEKDGIDYNFNQPNITQNATFPINSRYEYNIKNFYHDNQTNTYIYQISKCSKDREISVSSSPNPTRNIKNVDEVHYWISIRKNKLWGTTTINNYPLSTKQLSELFEKVFSLKLTFFQLPNFDVLDEIKKVGIAKFVVRADIQSYQLPNSTFIDKVKKLKDKFFTTIEINNSKNDNIFSDIDLDEKFIDSINDDNYIVLKGPGRKTIKTNQIKKQKIFYFKEFLTTHSVDFSSMKECLLDLWS